MNKNQERDVMNQVTDIRINELDFDHIYQALIYKGFAAENGFAPYGLVNPYYALADRLQAQVEAEGKDW